MEGFDNLYCMEIDPSVEVDEGPDLGAGTPAAATSGAMKGFLKEFANNIPGIDEAMSFAELMKHVQRMEFDVTVFDTAPTGHTLRLLALPGMMDKALTKVLSYRGMFSTAMRSMSAMMGSGGGELPSEEALLGKLDDMKSVVDAVQARIHDPDATTFVCVCIPEFLSLYETERLVQELSKFDIDTHNIVVNQVLFPASGAHCDRCAARMRMQGKYLDQIGDLYEDFYVVKTPLLNEEVRGAPKLRAFGEYLIKPYDPAVPLPAILDAGAGAGAGTGAGTSSSGGAGNKNT